MQRKRSILRAINLIFKWNKNYGLKTNIQLNGSRYLISTIKFPSNNSNHTLFYETAIFKNSYFKNGISSIKSSEIYSERYFDKDDAIYYHRNIVNHISDYIQYTIYG